jgi:hypothetical protein
MKKVFIISNTSGGSRRELKRIGAESDRNTLGFVVETYVYSHKLHKFKKPTVKKFKFFSEAFAFTNFETYTKVV